MTTPAGKHAGPADAIFAEVRANILAQEIAPGEAGRRHTVVDLNLPASLLAHITDRIVRSSFEDRHRSVFQDRPNRSAGTITPTKPPIPESWPALRGHHAFATDPSPDAFPDASHPREFAQAAHHIASRLAIDGLPRTAATVAAILHQHLGETSVAARHVLSRVGLPVDLLDFFKIDARPLLDHLLAAPSGAPVNVDAARFEFRQTRPGFRAVDEAGADHPALVRLQASRATHWDGEGGGPGSGDNLDVMQNLLRALPNTPFAASISAADQNALRSAIGVPNLTIAGAPHAVSQWAQDNLKPGMVAGSSDLIALLPRFASRAEIGAKLDPADTAALASLVSLGITPVPSPLHFQGGNVLFIRRPGGRGGGGAGASLLLIGEAEIARNATLGLTPDQSIAALCIEMGADDALVLPAVGFHIDTEVSVRAVGDELLAFVPDEVAAARIILRSALRTLEAAALLSRGDAKVLLTFLDHQNDAEAVTRLGGLFASAADAMGNIANSFAARFQVGKADSGAANAMRILTSLDILAARARLPFESSLHPFPQAYFQVLRRGLAERREFNDALTRAGLRVIPVPSLSAGSRSASVVNAVHMPGRMLIPVRGGFFKPLDDAAIKVLRTHLPANVEIVPIPSAESERRGGALHCSVALFPDPNV